MTECPCCSGLLLRHIRGGKTYYLCQNCHQELPLLAAQSRPQFQPQVCETIAVSGLTDPTEQTLPQLYEHLESGEAITPAEAVEVLLIN